MPDTKELSRDEKRKVRDERREKKKLSDDEYNEPVQNATKPPTGLKMISKISTTTSTDASAPPQPIHSMPVLPLHMRPAPPRPHMDNVPYFSPTPDEEQNGEGTGEGGVAKGKYCHYAQQVRKASVPRTAEIPHSVEETKESLKEVLERMANVPKYIEEEEQSEILHSIPKHEKVITKYNLALEGVHLEDSGSDTDNPVQEDEEPEVMSPEEPLPKIRERYLSLVSGDVVLDEDGNLIPRGRVGSDPLLAEARSLATRKESIDEAVQRSNSLEVPDMVVRPHSPVPKIRDRYLDVAQGKAEPKPEDPEVEAHREALMQQLREADLRKKQLEEERRQAYLEELRYQEQRKKQDKIKPDVPIKTTKQDYLNRMAAPPQPLPDEESVLAKASTPIDAIKYQLSAAASKPVEPHYHGIDPVMQDFISSEIDQAPLPGHGLLKWRYTPKESVPTAPRQKPRLKQMGEFSWVSVDAVEKQPKEPAWKECLELLNMRVAEEMKSPSPQE